MGPFIGKLLSALVLGLAAVSAVAEPISTVVTEASTLSAETEASTLITESESKATTAKLVVIIDDLGHELRRGTLATELPGKVTLAVLPYTRHGHRLAQAGHAAGKEIMLHAPMSTIDNTHPGTGALTLDLDEAEFRATLNAAILQVPHLKGVNNHMGSELTRHSQQMGWLMDELKKQGLYFVDSRTNKETVAARVASEWQVANLSRQVFLDNERTPEAVEERFNTVVAMAQDLGLAVAIGHPHQVTLEYLQAALPALASQGVELALVSEVLAQKALAVPEGGEPQSEDIPLQDAPVETQSLTSIPLSAM